ncbi:MAG: hypothetical protein IKV80_00565 [Bacteroidales bacterium]|nr:hypothetical protein [Bacteroidales bacterium]
MNYRIILSNSFLKEAKRLSKKYSCPCHYVLLVSEEESEINLLTIYDKAERENISRNEIEEILGSSEL